MGSLSVFWEVSYSSQRRKESPLQVRQRKRLLGLRVNSNLRIEFAHQPLTSYAGLELFSRYLRCLRFNERLHSAFAKSDFAGDYRLSSLVRLLLTLLLVGRRRLRHVAFLCHDLLVRRMAQLRCIPSERTLSRWLKQFNTAKLRVLHAVNTWIVVQEIHRLGLKLLTLDIDGSVVSAGMKVAWAFRGYNPHHRKVPSYFPILAHVAETGHILRLKNRPGNVHDGKRAERFIEDVVRQVRRLRGKRMRLQFRLDGALFQRETIQTLQRLGCHYAIKVPFWRWLGIKSLVQMRMRWRRVNEKVSCFEAQLQVTNFTAL